MNENASENASESTTGCGPWFKASGTTISGECVEVCYGAHVLVRDTKDRAGGTMAVSKGAWQAFVNGCGKTQAQDMREPGTGG